MTEKGKYQVPCIYQKRKRDRVEVVVPGSKSITNRALLLAAMAEGKSVLRGVLFSEDSRIFLKCIQELGFEIRVLEKEKMIEVTGHGGVVPKAEASIYVGSAGTAARFLSAYLAASNGRYYLDASEQMRRRPMAPLLNCLRELGCEIKCELEEGFFPFFLNSTGFSKQRICVDIGNSSQFLSALLIALSLSKEDIEIEVTGSHGMSYIQMTEKMMAQFGVSIQHNGERIYVVPGGQRYKALEYQIEPDVSAACYFYAMAPLLGIEVLVKNVYFHSLQGDVEFLKILEKMGCVIKETTEGIKVCGPKDGRYQGVEVDMSACSDQAITLAALAPFAKSPTTINGIGHIRYQESNRMQAIVTELKKMGISCEMGEDFIKIYPGRPEPSQVETYEDHRIAMGFSLIGLRAEGIVILNPDCCRKTFESYFQVLGDIIGKMQKE